MSGNNKWGLPNETCKRCGAPIPPDVEGEYHKICELISQMESEECVNCGSEDAEFVFEKGNLIQYHEKCGHAALNPHEQ